MIFELTLTIYQAAIEAKRTISTTLTTVIKSERKNADKKSEEAIEQNMPVDIIAIFIIP